MFILVYFCDKFFFGKTWLLFSSSILSLFFEILVHGENYHFCCNSILLYTLYINGLNIQPPPPLDTPQNKYCYHFLSYYYKIIKLVGSSEGYTAYKRLLCYFVNAHTLKIFHDTRVYAFLKMFSTNIQNKFLCLTNFNFNFSLL